MAVPKPVAAMMPPLYSPALAMIDRAERQRMLSASRDIRECYRVLEKAGLNVVGEVLRGQGEFIELEHYPHDDVFDGESQSQYYYHSHRPEAGEHGHFHTFLRAPGIADTIRPIDYPQASEPWPDGDDAITHIIGIAMDAWGYPIGLFATNRWVTGESWYEAEDIIAMLDRFNVDHAWPSWPVNRWISAMLVQYRQHIIELLRHRDAVISAWQEAHPNMDVFEDRRLDVTGYLPIDVDEWSTQLEGLES